MGKKGNKRKTRWRVLPIGGDDGSEDDDAREDGARERFYKPRPRFQHHTARQHSPARSHEKRTFNEDEYTRITTPRQDVLFKKGYLGRKRTTVDPNAVPQTNGINGTTNGTTNGTSGTNSSNGTNGDVTPNGESVDADCGGCGDGSEMLDEQAPYYYPNAFVDPNGLYYVNGAGFTEVYDPYTGTVTVVVGPGPLGPMGPPLGMPPMDWFNPRLPPPPPPHGPPPGPPHGPPMQPDYCYMHGRKRYSVDSQNCSGPSSESNGSGPPSSPQECESAGPAPPQGPSPGPPLPPMGPLPFPPHPQYVYPYMFGAPLYSLDGVSVQGAPPYGPACDVNAGSKRRKKKRRRKRRRGGVTDEGSEESSSEDKELEEGAGPSSLSSQSAASSQTSAQATPTDSDAFTEFVAKHSTLNGNASAWEPALLTPPQTPTDCQQLNGHSLSNGLPPEAPNVLENGFAVSVTSGECSANVINDSLPTSLEEATYCFKKERSSPVPQEPSPVAPLGDESKEGSPGAAPEIGKVPDSAQNAFAECASGSTESSKSESSNVIENGTDVHNAIYANCKEIITNGVHIPSEESSPDTSRSRSEEPEAALSLPPVISEDESLDLTSKSNKDSSKLSDKTSPVTEISVKATSVDLNSCPFKKSPKVTHPLPTEKVQNRDSPETALILNRCKKEVAEKPAKRLVKSDTPSARCKTTSPSTGRSKTGKKGGPKTDLKVCNGVMESKATSKDEDLALSLRPEAPLSWGGRTGDESKPRPMEDLLLRALVSTGPQPEATGDEPAASSELTTEPVKSVHAPAPEMKSEFAVAQEIREEVPQPLQAAKSAQSSPQPAQSAQNAQKARPSPASSSQRRPKKWRQNTKERAPTPGRELVGTDSTSGSSSTPTASTASPVSSPPSSLSSEEDESVIFIAPSVRPKDASPAGSPPAKPPPEPPEAKEPSPLRITEAVTAWLREHDSEDVLVTPPAHLSAPSESESEDNDDLFNEAGPKNEESNPFLASSRSYSQECSRHSGDSEKRVASDTSDVAWDPLCDPTLFVAKYYRLGEDPTDEPPIMAMELRDDNVTTTTRWPEHQHDSGVHSDESGDEHRGTGADGKSQGAAQRRAAQTAQAEMLATKSAFLLNQLKGQGPFPCGGICCALQ